jgi:hypothetical protein
MDSTTQDIIGSTVQTVGSVAKVSVPSSAALAQNDMTNNLVMDCFGRPLDLYQKEQQSDSTQAKTIDTAIDSTSRC